MSEQADRLELEVSELKQNLESKQDELFRLENEEFADGRVVEKESESAA